MSTRFDSPDPKWLLRQKGHRGVHVDVHFPEQSRILVVDPRGVLPTVHGKSGDFEEDLVGAVPVPGDFVKDLFPSQGRLTRASKVIEEYRDIPNKVLQHTFETRLTLRNLSHFLRFYRLRQHRGLLAFRYFSQFLGARMVPNLEAVGGSDNNEDQPAAEIVMLDGSDTTDEIARQVVSAYVLADLLDSKKKDLFRKHEGQDLLPITLTNKEGVMSISFFLLTPVCSHCGKLAELPVDCPSCTLVRYCSQDCLEEGAEVHKEECEDHRHLNCKNCNKKSTKVKLRRCSECKAVRYCSKDCQQTHWSLHKHHCAELKAKQV